MRQLALLVALAGVAFTAPPAGAQLPDVTLPETELPLPEAPEVEPVELPGGDAGGGEPLPAPTAPSAGGGSETSAGSTGGGDSGSATGSRSTSRSRDGGSSGARACPCAAPATGNPVAGDYDKCPRDESPPPGEALLAGERSETPPAAGGAGGEGDVLGAQEEGEGAGNAGAPEAAPPAAAEATPLLAWAVFAAMGLCLLAALAGALRALHGRLRG